MNKKYNKFEIYNESILIILNRIKRSNSPFQTDLENFLSDLNILSKYMLLDRFSGISNKKPSKKKLTRKEQRILELSNDSAVQEYLNPLDSEKNVVASKEVSALDIIKVFKGLELFILKRRSNVSLADLKLGTFSDLSQKLFDNLSTLLLSVRDIENKSDFYLVLFSAIRIYRQFSVKTKPNLETITKAYTGQDLDVIIDNEFSKENITKFLNTLPDYLFDNHYSAKFMMQLYSGNASSPNSGPSSAKLIHDYIAVRNDKKLHDNIMGLGRIMPLDLKFNFVVTDYEDKVDELKFKIKENPDELIHSKLFHFTAPGGKSRVIANVDWLTQTALSGIHYHFFEILKNLKSDFTFKHKEGIPYLWRENSKDKFYSIDLSAATDRMPRLLQAELINAVYSKFNYFTEGEIRKKWLNIVDRKYCVKNMGLNVDSVRYTVGQGMGLMSSWPVMALTHHYIVNSIAQIPTEDYALVGDDLLIRNNTQGYHRYIGFMDKIGLQVNLNKTIESQPDNISLEFASNFVIDNNLIIPIQYGVLYAIDDDKVGFESFIYNQPNLSATEIKDFFYKFVIEDPKYKSSLKRKIAHLALFFAKIKQDFNWDDYVNVIDISKIRKVNYDRIVEIARYNIKTKPVTTEFDNRLHRDVFLNLRSQLMVRNESSLAEVTRLSKQIYNIITFDKDLISSTFGLKSINNYYVDLFTKLENVQILVYSVDKQGNPLLSHKERNLLKKLLDLQDLKEKRKVLKLS